MRAVLSETPRQLASRPGADPLQGREFLPEKLLGNTALGCSSNPRAAPVWSPHV